MVTLSPSREDRAKPRQAPAIPSRGRTSRYFCCLHPKQPEPYRFRSNRGATGLGGWFPRATDFVPRGRGSGAETHSGWASGANRDPTLPNELVSNGGDFRRPTGALSPWIWALMEDAARGAA